MSKKNRTAINSLILLAVALAFVTFAFRDGVTGKTFKNGNGCDCHGAAPFANVTVSITGPDELTIAETATYTLVISGGPLLAGGTNIAASAGILNTVSGAGLQKIGDELTHVQPKMPLANEVSFEFSFTAPSDTGSVTLYANGNSVNLDNSNSGDQWNFAPNKTINVVSTTNVEEQYLLTSFKLNQNYPNPFNPSTIISFTLAASEKVSLSVYNILGDEVAKLVYDVLGEGYHSFDFNGSDLASGVYFYKLSAGNFVDTKKMVLLQ